ncbi:MAG TPA: holo-ACP synthase [Solirubrobacteraceae bacterium]|nr:holo-ACP synthase [Solirubrobacteraceae bacterium]
MALRVGTDLVLIETVRDSLDAHAEHYLERVFTEREVEDCTMPDGIDPERLAARFAAKEATLKVLRPRDEGIPWSAIEVRRNPNGWVEVELSGPAQALAADGGVTDLSLSISHEGDFATAVVVASCSQGMPTSVR